MAKDKEMVDPTEHTAGSYKGETISLNLSCQQCVNLKSQNAKLREALTELIEQIINNEKVGLNTASKINKAKQTLLEMEE